MNKTLRWGLLSTARINRAIIAALRASERNHLAAVASRDLGKAQAYAQEWNIPRALGSYEALLADPDMDVIYNSLPNSLHAEWTIKAAQAGKHVLSEKPFAMTLAEVDAMSAAARQAGVVVTEAFMYRHHPQTLKVKELLDSGALGQLRSVHGAFTFNIASGPNVRLAPELGGGSIWDTGCYLINFVRYVTGAEPFEVFGWQVTGQSGVDMTFAAQLRFPGGVLAQLESSFQQPFRSRTEVVGSEATITVPRTFLIRSNPHLLLTRGDDVETIAIPEQDSYRLEIEDLYDAILQGRSPRVTLADSRGNIAVITALLESARLGQPVAL
jgi:predicted dehydrogenase